MPPIATNPTVVPPHPAVRIGDAVGHLFFHPLPAGSPAVPVVPAHAEPVVGEVHEMKAVAEAFVEQLEADPRLARRFLVALFAGIKS